MLYLADEIGTTGKIGKISYWSNKTGGNRIVKVYMAMSDITSLSSSTVMDVSNMTLVYSGTISVIANDWTDIELTTPFNYSGNNLVIDIQDITGDWVSNTPYWKVDDKSGRVFKNYDEDGEVSAKNGSSYDYLPQIKITFAAEGDCLAVMGNVSVTNLSSSGAKLSWTDVEEGAAYQLQYKKSNQNWEDITQTIDVTSNSYEFEGTLDDNTEYNVRIRHNCITEQSSWKNVSFKTNCVSIVVSDNDPYSESFDDASSLNCWSQNSLGSWTISSGALHHDGGTNTEEILSPVFNLTGLTTPYIQFEHKQQPYWGYNSGITVYYRTSSDSPWIQFASFQDTQADFKKDSLGLPYASSSYQLKFEFNASYGSVSIDNLIIYNQTNVAECSAPIAVTVSNVTTTTADVSWYQMGNGSEWKIYYKKSSSSSWEDLIQSFEMPTTIDDLTPSSSYDLYVALVCDGEEAASDIITFNTVCSALTANELPISNDFETEEVVPHCWTLVNGEADIFSYDPNTGKQHLFVLTSSGNDFILSLPGYSEDISQLQLSFFGKAFLAYSETVNVTIQIGVSTDLTDTTNFAEIVSWQGSQISAEEYTEFTASFANVFTLNPTLEQYAAVYYPVIRIVNGTGDYFCIDDITLEEIPTCPKATDLAVMEVEGDKITVTWSQSDEEDVASYNVYYRLQGTAAWSAPQTVTQKTATIENLTPSTTYEIYVQTVCDEESNDSSNILTAKTACSAFDVPWSTSFETDDAYELPNCWTLLNGYTNSYGDVYPYIFQSSYSSYAGEKCLYLYAFYSPNILALPLFTTDVKSLQLTFQSRPTNIKSAGSISVCVTNNISDTNNLEYVWTKNCSEYASAVYTKEVINFNNITTTGDNIYIVIVHQNGSYWYIDDVKVDVLPDCDAATNITMSDISPTSAVITWKQEDEGITAWKVCYKSSTQTSWTNVDVTCSTVNTECDDSLHTTSYILENLTPDVTYDIYVASMCGENNPSSDIISFKTLCNTVVVTDESEYTEPFASESALSCWQLSSTSSYSKLEYYNGTLDIPDYSSAKASAITPLFDISAVTTPYLKYKYKLPVRNNGSNQYVDKFTVYYRTSVSESWKELKDYTEQQNVLVQDSVALPEASQTYQLRFYFEGKNGGGLTIDDVSVYNELNPPSCVAAMQIAVTEIEKNSATITWMQPDNSSSWNVYYKKVTDTDYEYTSVTETSFTITELESNTYYNVYIETDCGVEDNPVSDVISFKTDCDAITVTEENPYIEGFESYTADSLSSPDCWAKVREGKSSMRIQVNTTTNKISGSKVLTLRAGKANKVAIIALPEFTNDLNTLAVSFYLRSSSANNAGTLSFGYITDLSDTSTFVALKSFPKTQNTWLLENLYMDDFAAVLDGVNDAYFAFRHDNSEYAGSSYEQFFIDSVAVSLIPACKEITGVTVSDIDANSAKITWNGSAQSYKVKVSNGNTVAYENDTCSVTEIEVNTLIPATSYTVSVQGVCSDTTTSVVSKTFVTSCVALTEADLPKTWDFETDNTAGTASYPLPTCWKRTNGTYPYIYIIIVLMPTTAHVHCISTMVVLLIPEL